MANRDPFCARVEGAMGRRGLTLRGLCRACAMDPSFFSKVLAGKRSPPSEEAALRRIASVLELDAVELIVAAGRIPAEWRGLWEDDELFRDVHALAAASKAPPSPKAKVVLLPPEGAAAKDSSPSVRPASAGLPHRPQRLAEELL